MIRAMIYAPVIILTVMLAIVIVLEAVDRFYYCRWLDELMDDEEE